jgi:hypothetical protein
MRTLIALLLLTSVSWAATPEEVAAESARHHREVAAQRASDITQAEQELAGRYAARRQHMQQDIADAKLCEEWVPTLPEFTSQDRNACMKWLGHSKDYHERYQEMGW